MIQIRKNVFETNSSSTHCMVIGTASDFEKWEDGEVYYYDNWREGKKFITKEEAIDKRKNSKYRTSDTDKAIKYLETCELDASDYDDDEDEAKRAIFEEMANNYVYEYDYYFNDYCGYLESVENTYITPGGETIKIACHYGYDG